MHPISEIMLRVIGYGTQSHDDQVQAIEELRQLGVEALQYLVQTLYSSDDLIRQHAATVMMMAFGLEGQKLLLPLSQDPNDNLRFHVCGLLYDFGDADALITLVDRLRNDSVVSIRALAADALERIGSRGVVIPDYVIAALEETVRIDREYGANGFSPSEQAQRALSWIRHNTASEEETA